MPELRLGTLLDDKPVRLTVELPAEVHRNLVAYAEIMSRDIGQAVEPAKLVAPMLARFMAADRAFAKQRRIKDPADTGADPAERDLAVRPVQSEVPLRGRSANTWAKLMNWRSAGLPFSGDYAAWK